MKATIILSICALILFAHCQTNPTPSIKTQDSVEIVTDTIPVPYFYCLVFGSKSADTTRIWEQWYHIKNSTEFDTTFRYHCTNILSNPPTLDFSNRDLIGYTMIIRDSSLQIEKHLLKDYNNKKFIYQIRYSYSYLHAVTGRFGGFASMNWLLIPKIPNDWTFEIDTSSVITE
ncbi:MAG: hypothetical protein NT007_15725 [Candidatus Kapabacteria bacterium]|nr:hypothetical protein [Candidatus Kapabacteria bacterium]